MTRIWLSGQFISVIERDGVPTSFIWRNEQHIEHIDNHWRLDTQWWRGRICRDYFLVRTVSGMLAVIYCDRLTNRWYIERLYD